jgi:hypothetical protein
MDNLYFKHLNQADNAALKETRAASAKTAEWILEHLVDIKFNPKAPTVFDIWSRSGTLKQLPVKPVIKEE